MPDHVDLVQSQLNKLGERLDQLDESAKGIDQRLRDTEKSVASIHTTQKITAGAVAVGLPILAAMLTAIVVYARTASEAAIRAEARADVAASATPTGAFITSRPFRDKGITWVNITPLTAGGTQVSLRVEVKDRETFTRKVREAAATLGGKIVPIEQVMANAGVRINRDADLWPECSYCIYGPLTRSIADLSISLPVEEQLTMNTPEFEGGLTLQGIAGYVNAHVHMVQENAVPPGSSIDATDDSLIRPHPIPEDVPTDLPGLSRPTFPNEP